VRIALRVNGERRELVIEPRVTLLDALRKHLHPITGLDVRFGVSTLERWYDAARRAGDPLHIS
jgi:hypothetical protein